VNFRGNQVPEVRPDGLLVCQRGKSCWSALIESKAESQKIRTDQIASYIDLARAVGVDTIVTISNEFARVPTEPPYRLDGNQVRGIQVLHFAWADLRTMLELLKNEPELCEIEKGLLQECLHYLWDERSGVETFDAMPDVWPAFVEAASTTLGFNANVRGFGEIVSAWQQERRDLCSKLMHRLGTQVELRHPVGVYSSDDERTQADRRDLADEYKMSAQFLFKDRRLSLDVLLNLHACRMTAAMQIPVPENKGARATVSWLSRSIDRSLTHDAKLHFDWPYRGHDAAPTVEDFLCEPDIVLDGQREAPKCVKLNVSKHGVRSFKSRKKVISDLESMVFELVDFHRLRGWL
jgi:hypothetical protein